MLSDYDKGVFTPDCLIGVETTKGFITDVVGIVCDIEPSKPSYCVYTTERLSEEDLHDVRHLGFFISDYSNEAVTFEEYVRMFYEG